ncbi:MAG TPA: T9SS type A sorting domain-containing protein, partial [Flavipsychrobacter sp.]|nr:T9SS type A sorting domain-containing protein [Flavipsychrobacter sp.]
LEELSQDWNNNSWENQNRVLCTYDGNNNLLSQEYENWVSNAWVKSYLYIYYYDGNNNMIANKSAWWNAGTSQYDSANHNVFYYNTNNQVDSSLYYSWNSGWQLGNRTVSYYDGNNVNIGYLSQNWVNNAWENNLQSFTLFDQNNIPCGDSVQNWLLYNNTWRNFSRGKSTFDMNGNAVEYLYQKWDTGYAAFINDYIDSVTYNSYDQPTWNKRQGWDTTNQMWVGRYAFTENRYYYELYTADVKDMKKTGSELKLYPVPARSNINIQVNWNKPQDFTAAIYDIQGRLLRQWGEKACKEYKANMQLQGMPPGNYVLKLRGKGEQLEKRFVIAE